MKYASEELLKREERLFRPTEEEAQEYAKRNSDLVIYEKPFLLSPDRKVMYGYSELESFFDFEIPDEVEVYDNVCWRSEEEPEPISVIFGRNFRGFAQGFDVDCFGYRVERYCTRFYPERRRNKNFSFDNGMLLDKTKTQLLAFPSGRFSAPHSLVYERSDFVQLSMTIKKICANAFAMMLLPVTLVIPDSVEIIEKGAFYEYYDKGLHMSKNSVKARSIILPERFRGVIDATWKADYDRPSIRYY
jgi:hypothetical protein